MGLEFDDTNGITQRTDFTGQDQAASDPGPAPVSENSNQSDGWATGQSQDIGDMFHRFSPQQQLMASKIGLFGNRNLPKDASGRMSYNAFTDSYGSSGGSGMSLATTQSNELQLRPPLKERLGFDAEKVMVEEGNKKGVSYEPTLNERLTGAFQYNVRGNKTAEEHRAEIVAPFEEIGKFAKDPIDYLTPPSIRKAQESWGGRQEIPPSANNVLGYGVGAGLNKGINMKLPSASVGSFGPAFPVQAMASLDDLAENILGKPYWHRENPEVNER
ncbi:hypothetical protein [Fundidesulfovibrio putealis]|uniref:hypothetical protein n=1 Tax=Fundidesulfovibrio putealis TaxID=270496 RepID=UPI000488DF1A|nr:hypothetical protein [Fundidesulfovibrio putealis]